MDNIEKESKYIFDGDINFLKTLKSSKIKQGYLYSNLNNSEVRIRIKDDKAYLTYKENTNKADERIEIEEEISLELGNNIIKNLQTAISKTRYFYTDLITIDVFENIDLILVEVEGFDNYIIPEFCGKDVTKDSKYKNSNLIKTINNGT